MQGHDFIYCLTDRTGTNPNFWGIDANGKAKLSATPYFLEFSPEGWLDMSIQNIKNRKYWGVDRSITIPFGYVEDGATILKTCFYKFGPENPVFLKVCRLTLDYEPAPNGILVFTNDQSPFTPNGTPAGTITGTPGSTVLVRMNITNPDVNDSVVGFFDSFNFNFNWSNPNPTYSLIVPASGVINFSIHFTQVPGSTSTAGMELVNANGNTAGNYGFWYKQIYVGQVNLADFDHKGSKVTVSTLEDGLPKYLRSNEATVFELAMNVPEAITILMDGIVLHNRATWFIGNGTLPNDAQNHLLDMQLLIKDVQDIGDVFTVDREVVNGSTDMISKNKPFFKASVDTTITIDYDFILGLEYVPPPGQNPAAVYFIHILHADPNGNVVTQNLIFQRGAGPSFNGSFHLQNTITVPVLKGNRLFLWGHCTIIGTSGDSNILSTYSGEGLWRVTYTSRFTETYIKALPPGYILQQLISLVTDGTYSVDVGNGLDWYFGINKHWNKPFSCGNAIRGFTDAVMKISLNQFFQFWDCFDAIGISPKGNKITFDRKRNLIDFNNSISLGQLSNVQVILDKDKSYNELAIGYPEIKNEAGVLNGNDEFNCGFLFSTGTTLSPKKLEKVPVVKASCYEMELIRISTAGKSSTDYKNDNENYCIHIGTVLQPASGSVPAHYLLDRVLNAFATGLLEPATVFNIELSPKRNLLRNGDFLRSSLYLQDGRILAYKSSDKNNKMITTVGLTTVEEKAGVVIGDLDSKFFLPVLLIGEVIVPFNILELLDLNPLQLFDFEVDGTIYKGIMEELALAPGTEKEQTGKFTSTADNDLTKLIDYYG